ncbi:cytochrome b5 domain-containing protein [Clostridium sp.]|uniref:cytochrome b5 domain-containing protein n=1 Tax=Clostridium sp. TaxID=1506 RepID=UPI0026DD80D8|nr:cytochrome b5 domain-containing protein [Clostridium sp.]MDO5038362.1 cytochrome b5 domain-containing protein [Clostridium sp.]
MLLEKIINKKNKDLNELKDMLFYRNDDDRKQIIRNIKVITEDLFLLLEEEKNLRNNFVLKIRREFTLGELSKYNGKNNNLAYVAIDGTVYDVTGVTGFNENGHFGVKAGTDVTESFYECHKGDKSILSNLRIIGVLKQ